MHKPNFRFSIARGSMHTRSAANTIHRPPGHPDIP
jgi:hypothetical protein